MKILISFSSISTVLLKTVNSYSYKVYFLKGHCANGLILCSCSRCSEWWG